MNLKKNVGKLDSNLRTIIGIILPIIGILGLTNLINIGITITGILIVAGGILLFTGVNKTCPAYQIIGTDTVKTEVDI